MKMALRNMASVALGLALLIAGAQAARAAECSEGTKVSDDCMGYTYEGCCGANEETYWCDTETGPTCMIACADSGGFCAWSGTFYGCGEASSEDPTGTFPYSCAACDPACSEGQWCNVDTCEACSCGTAVCGVDQCGNSCGECLATEECSAGVCAVPPTCVEAQTVTCDDVIDGTTVGATSALDTYSCAAEMTGAEVAYKFVPAANDMIRVANPTLAENTGILVLEGSCWESKCIGGGIGFDWFAVEAGKTYFLVVDGYQLAEGAYNFKLECQSTCQPVCAGKDCGDDGCGGTCGTCSGDLVCGASSTCIAPSDFECKGGSEPSAATCGEIDNEIGCCDEWGRTLWCQNGALYCIDCATGNPSCGWSVEGGYYDCGTDGSSDPSGTNPMMCPALPTCTANCTGKTCGDDGCGGTCGTCGTGETCNAAGTCEAACVPNCTGKTCGDDGCDGSCGLCGTGETCNAAGTCEATACVPNCTGKECGDDGCGTACGTCAAGETCQNSLCVGGTDEDVVTPSDTTVTPTDDVVVEIDVVVTPTDNGGSSSGCTANTQGNATSSILLAMALAALFFVRRFRG